MSRNGCFVGCLALLLVALSMGNAVCYGKDDCTERGECGHYIEGMVYDADGETLDGVKVTLKGKNGYKASCKTTLDSDIEGYFGFFDGCGDWKKMKGSYILTCKKAGYKTYKTKVSFDGKNYLEFFPELEEK